MLLQNKAFLFEVPFRIWLIEFSSEWLGLTQQFDSTVSALGPFIHSQSLRYTY